MWFLKGRPSSITVQALISSIAGGYQQTNYRFNINAEGKVWIAIAFPWSPHKPNGSFKIVDTDLLSQIKESKENTILTADDIKIWERLRSLKTEPNIELMHVQELINWYLDDIGVITFWAEPGKTYQLNYSHKIASDSCLFLPTRLPVVIASRKPEMDYGVWVVNGLIHDLAKHLKRETIDPQLQELVPGSSLDYLSFKEITGYREKIPIYWEWDEDTRVNTNNWESSDDDWESSDEENS